MFAGLDPYMMCCLPWVCYDDCVSVRVFLLVHSSFDMPFFFFHFISLQRALLLLLVVVVGGGGVGSNGGNRNDSGCVSMFLFLFRYAFFHPSSCMTKLKRSSNVYQTIIKLMHALNIVYYGNKWYIVSFFCSSS